MEPITLSESVVIDAAIPNTEVQVSDTIGEYSFSTLEAVSISETVNLYMRTGFLRATEDGYQRLTEDGGRRITE